MTVVRHAAAEPHSTRHPLWADLWIITHAEDGEPLAHVPSLSLGLAGALLTHLVLPTDWDRERQGFSTSRALIVGDAVIVTDPMPTGKPLVDWATAHLHAAARTSVRDALNDLALFAYDKVQAALFAADMIRPVERRRLLARKTTYPLSNSRAIYQVRGRLCHVVQTFVRIDPETDALGGLFRALNLEPQLYLDLPDISDRRDAMTRRLGRTTRAAERVIHTTQDLIGEAATAVYR